MALSIPTDEVTLGVVGGGQLGRMLAEAAAPLGVETIVLDPTPDCPAATVASDQIQGDFDDPDPIHELAARADVLTYEIELADPDVLASAGSEFDVPVHPSPETLATIQDKYEQKHQLRDHDIPVPKFRAVSDVDDLLAALDDLGTPAMLKARTGGYDGRGNVPIESVDDAEAAFDAISGPAMVEAFVEFERELSVIGVRGADEIATFPVGENVHEAEILRETVVPARTTSNVRERATALAKDVLELLSGRGVFGIELFETTDGRLLVNEIAPRPHNSGHYTIEGCVTSQFEQHVRATLGWPLGSTELRSPVVSKNVLGDVDEPRPAELSGIDAILGDAASSLHWYGKREVRPLRKMGHFTMLADDTDSALTEARTLRDSLTFQ